MKDKILIIDDYELSRVINEIELGPLKMPILKAANAQEAIDLLTTEKNIKIVTLDMIMPDMDGLELLTTIKMSKYQKKMNEIGNDPYFLFITDDHSEETQKKAFDLGALHFFNKPIVKGDLIKACRHLISPIQRFKGLGVLIVEDSNFERTILIKILKPLGIKIFEAENAMDALEIAKEHKNDIHLIISDLYLGKENADIFFKKVRYYLNLTEIPMITISVDNKPETIIKLYNSGASDYIIKPYLIEELLNKVETNLQNQYLKKISEQQLWEMQKLIDFRDKTLASHTHDLRSPLHNIMGCADLISNKDNIDSETLEFAKQISQSSQYMNLLITEVLEQKKEEFDCAAHHSVFNFSESLKNAANSVKYAANVKGIELKLIIAEDLYIKGHRLSLIRCISNLLSNAIKFTPRGGLITLNAKITKDGFISIKISDTGIGIKEKQLEHIFEEYNNASKPGTEGEPSTGLGLSIVKNIIEAHGGIIRVNSQEKVGTHFSIYLKAVSKKMNLNHEDLKILIADDQQSNLNLLKKMLESMKINVKTATSGNELYELYKSEENINLIITDINMPGLNGNELAEKIRKEGDHDIKIIALTGDAKAKANKNIDSYLTKPITFDELWNSLASF